MITEAPLRAVPAITAGAERVGYVLKMFPRFSETFVLNEILAHQRAGMDLEIFSLRLPNDGRYHAELAQVRAPVTQIEHGGLKVVRVWDIFSEGVRTLPRFQAELSELADQQADDALQAIELAIEVRRRGIDHLHAHFASVATTVARLAARLAGITYSFTAHAKDIFHESVDDEDLRRKAAGASAVVTVSEFNRRHLVSEVGIDVRKVQRIYNGIDLRRFAFNDSQERPPRIVGIGRLVPKKGFHDLVAAARVLADAEVDFECLIVGAGPLEADLRADIVGRGLEDRVRLVGPRPQDEVVGLVQDAAVMAAPCVVGADANRDGLPTVLLEAMALGTACVATDVTGIPEALMDGVTGLGVAQNAPAELAQALARLLDDRDLRGRLAAKARALVEQRFDLERQTESLRSVIGAASAAVAR